MNVLRRELLTQDVNTCQKRRKQFIPYYPKLETLHFTRIQYYAERNPVKIQDSDISDTIQIALETTLDKIELIIIVFVDYSLFNDNVDIPILSDNELYKSVKMYDFHCPCLNYLNLKKSTKNQNVQKLNPSNFSHNFLIILKLALFWGLWRHSQLYQFFLCILTNYKPPI